jgi:vitamin B12 transporter
MKITLPILAQLVPALLIVMPVAAQVEQPDTVPAYWLEEVTVTTTRAQVDRERVPQRIDLVGAQDFAKSGARNAGEALRSTVAIDAIQYPGLLTGVSIRGFRPQFSGTNPRTLILLDGRPAGTNNLALFHIGGVQRMEVLRGPASALHGPNAMGGVVNVIRRRSSGPITGDVAIGYGSFGAYEGRINTGGSLARGVDFDLSVTTIGQRSGYRAGSNRSSGTDSLLKTLPSGETVQLPWSSADTVIDFTRFSSRGLNGRVAIDLPDGWRLDLAGEEFTADDVENPGDLNVVDWDSRTLKDATRRSIDLMVTGSQGRHEPSVRVYRASEEVDYYSAAEGPKFVDFRTPIRSYGAQLQNVVDLGIGRMVAGIDHSVSDSRSERFGEPEVRAAPYSPDSRVTGAAAFGEGTVDLFDDRFGASLGLRYDRIDFEIRETPHLAGFPPNRERRGVFTPTIGLRYNPRPALRLYGNVGEAFVNPDAFQVAGYSENPASENQRGVFVTKGNPHLRPETSLNWDGGFTVLHPEVGLEIDLAYFHTDVRDRIATSISPASTEELNAQGDTILSTTSYINVDEAEIRGLETRLSFDFGRFLHQSYSLRLFANGTMILRSQERFVESGLTRGIRNVANRTIIGGIDFDDPSRLRGRLTGRYVGERVDTDYVAWYEPGEIRYPPYLVLDLHLALRLAGRYRIGLDIGNLGDEDYFEVRGYNLPGRSLRLGIGATF